MHGLGVLETFKLVGQAFGLYIKETRVKAVYISIEPMPNDIKALDSDFKDEHSWSKLLGFHIGRESLHHNRSYTWNWFWKSGYKTLASTHILS